MKYMHLDEKRIKVHNTLRKTFVVNTNPYIFESKEETRIHTTFISQTTDKKERRTGQHKLSHMRRVIPCAMEWKTVHPNTETKTKNK